MGLYLEGKDNIITYGAYFLLTFCKWVVFGVIFHVVFDRFACRISNNTEEALVFLILLVCKPVLEMDS